MLPSPHAILTLLLLVVLSCGCDDDSSSVPVDATTDSAPTDTTSPSDSIYVDVRCPAEEPNADYDQDGLSNGTEDLNRNCQLDPGETDPSLADTDGDGLADGVEDLNADGVTSNGELDPRLSDTDEDGLEDGDEPLSLICTPSLLEQLHVRTASASGVVLTSPTPLTSISLSEAEIDLFHDNQGIYSGLVFESDAEALPQRLEDAKALLEEAVSIQFEVEALNLQLWDGFDPEGNPRAAHLMRLEATLGEGSPNPSHDRTSAGVLRDAFAEHLSGLTPDWETKTGDPDDHFKAGLLAIDQGEGRALILFLVASASALSAPEQEGLFQDYLYGRSWAPASFRPEGYSCEEHSTSAEDLSVDFLWVVDNTRSMGEEQNKLAHVLPSFFDQLTASRFDWRIGVTTTESYLLETEPELLVHDEALDLCSGLRGEGFLHGDTEELETKLNSYIKEDLYCDPSTVNVDAPMSRNLCGDERESGLWSSLHVLNADPALCGAEYAFRPDVKKVIIWASDEEDSLVKITDPFAPLPKGDPKREALLEPILDTFLATKVRGCALVGDDTCEPLPNQEDAVEGAQPGFAYQTLAAETGGESFSLCEEDLGDAVEGCAKLARGVKARFLLSHRPIPGSIQVLLEGEPVQRGPEGWQLEADDRTIVLSDSLPLRERSPISCAYLEWVDLSP